MLGRLNARMLREICTRSHAHNVGYVAAIPILFTYSIQIPIDPLEISLDAVKLLNKPY